MSLFLRPETQADAAAIRAVNEAAFARATEADLVDALRRDGALVLSLVAERDKELVGQIAFSRVEVVDGNAVEPALALAPVAVHPAVQRQGIGSALIMDSLKRLRWANETLVFVVGEPGFYARFGFDAGAAVDFTSAYSGPYFQSLAMTNRAPLRGEVRYATAFSALS